MYFIGVFVALQWLEIPVLENYSDLATAYLLTLRGRRNFRIALDNGMDISVLGQEAHCVIGRPDPLNDRADLRIDHSSVVDACGLCCTSSGASWTFVRSSS